VALSLETKPFVEEPVGGWVCRAPLVVGKLGEVVLPTT
jgi:hypothetical protein